MRPLIVAAVTALAVAVSGAPLAMADSTQSTGEDCMAIEAATRTLGTIQAVSSTRIKVNGASDYWMPELGWVPTLAKVTVQRRGSDGTWASFNAVEPYGDWQITANPGVYRLAYLRDCAAPYAASSSRAVRVTAPKPVAKRPAKKPVKRDTYYANCAAARAAGAAPILQGDPGYRAGLDRDGDGVACE